MRGVIEHDSAIPVYRQIAKLLEADIRSGTLERGARVPSENYLCQQYGVSRDTARKAIALLRDAGLIVTTPGKGSYVA
jgi:DNA-binding GntR family transcriptional regulator